MDRRIIIPEDKELRDFATGKSGETLKWSFYFHLLLGDAKWGQGYEDFLMTSGIRGRLEKVLDGAKHLDLTEAEWRRACDIAKDPSPQSWAGPGSAPMKFPPWLQQCSGWLSAIVDAEKIVAKTVNGSAKDDVPQHQSKDTESHGDRT